MSAQAIAERVVSRDEQEGSLESFIQHQLGGRVRDLRVFVRENGIVLKGRSSTYHARQLAQQVAMEYCGLPILANDIDVR